ncbi:MAG: hypothetical protein ACFFBD_21570 [Candidatus Hodarchaeota archaeon]
MNKGIECPLCLATNEFNARFCQFCGSSLDGGVIQSNSSQPQDREIQPSQSSNTSSYNQPTTYQSQRPVVIQQRRSFFHDFFLFMFLWQFMRWIGMLIVIFLGGGRGGRSGPWR